MNLGFLSRNFVRPLVLGFKLFESAESRLNRSRWKFGRFPSKTMLNALLILMNTWGINCLSHTRYYMAITVSDSLYR